MYDTAKTPYQRLLASGVLTPAKQAEVAATYRGLNPVLLLGHLNGHLEKLWKLAERPVQQQRKARTPHVSVTGTFDATIALRVTV